MQDEFADSSRGQALINRIKDDAALRDCEVRVMAQDAAQNRVAVKRGSHGGAAVAVDEPKPALDQKGTRRAPRIRIKDGVEVAVDGNPAALIDLSTVGAQVVSPTVLEAEPTRPRDHGRRQDRGEVRRRHRVGGVRNAERACRPAIAPASTSAPTPTPPASRASPRKIRKE